MTAPFWNEQRLSQLRDLWASDLSASQIAHKLGTTKGAILGKAHRSGLAELTPKRTRYSPPPTVATFPLAGSEAPVRQPPKEEGEWRGKPVPTDLDEGQVMKMIAAAERRPKNGVLLLKLKPHHCRWPISGGDRKGDEYRFCGEPRVGGKYAFCEAHAKRAFYSWPSK